MLGASAAALSIDAPVPSNFDEVWTPGASTSSTLTNDDAATVFVADIRNDDTLILTQLVVLFSILHNALVTKLNSGISAPARFEYARAALVRMYHNIIANDVLPRIVHDGVLKVLCARQSSCSNWLWNGTDMPLEFSHGAFRFGHAMVKGRYQFNNAKSFGLPEILGGPNVGRRSRDPLPRNWVVAWERFFDLGTGQPPNFALKLTARKQLPLDADRLLPEVAPNTPDIVAVRDWMSAAAARMWRPDAMIAKIQKNYPRLNFFLTTSKVHEWLNDRINAAAPNSRAEGTMRNAVADLASDLPLPLYVLLESSLDENPATRGRRLGPLGSVIVGEVLFRCLAEAKDRQKSGLSAAIDAFDEDDWLQIASVRTMPALIRLAADWGGLTNCPEIPFIA